MQEYRQGLYGTGDVFTKGEIARDRRKTEFANSWQSRNATALVAADPQVGKSLGETASYFKVASNAASTTD